MRIIIQRKLGFITKVIELIKIVDIMSVSLVDAAERVCGSDRPNNDAWNAIRKKCARERLGAIETESIRVLPPLQVLARAPVVGDSLRW